ncbi:hypothetical protein GGX14DRAFT_400884 [Mycena pura]|uniref:Uncharacterized protein n=1 Tax=Mycena pura TaxID=153505 RepID=A0AAD6V249_9AGAR|nr:hypothetical protein GGX14DRAFT_400884 [Mycena pura]
MARLASGVLLPTTVASSTLVTSGLQKLFSMGWEREMRDAWHRWERGRRAITVMTRPDAARRRRRLCNRTPVPPEASRDASGTCPSPPTGTGSPHKRAVSRFCRKSDIGISPKFGYRRVRLDEAIRTRPLATQLD